MDILYKIKRIIFVFLSNALAGTHFFCVKRCFLRLAGIKVGIGTSIVGPIYVGNVSKVTIGDNSWIGKDFKVHGNGEIRIGSNVDIGPETEFLTGGHEIGNSKRRAGKGMSYKYSVGNGTWIGARTTIFANIGESCIVAACSVVNKDLPNNIFAAGCPCQVKKTLE